MNVWGNCVPGMLGAAMSAAALCACVVMFVRVAGVWGRRRASGTQDDRMHYYADVSVMDRNETGQRVQEGAGSGGWQVHSGIARKQFWSVGRGGQRQGSGGGDHDSRVQVDDGSAGAGAGSGADGAGAGAGGGAGGAGDGANGVGVSAGRGGGGRFWMGRSGGADMGTVGPGSIVRSGSGGGGGGGGGGAKGKLGRHDRHTKAPGASRAHPQPPWRKALPPPQNPRNKRSARPPPSPPPRTRGRKQPPKKDTGGGGWGLDVQGDQLMLRKGDKPVPIMMSHFLDLVEAKKLKRVDFSPEGKSLVAVDNFGDAYKVRVLPDGAGADEMFDLLRRHRTPFGVQEPLEMPVAVPLLGLLVKLFMTKQEMKTVAGAGGVMDLFRTRNFNKKMKTGVTFDDVAGCQESKHELVEVVDFLKNPKKYVELGARPPCGVLLEGPPGTGKTLLARAVAGEAGVPFLAMSGSEFVEAIVGMGASRIRRMFVEARKIKPCIIFIDEIDAIGRKRDTVKGGSDAEHEQTLNQLLTEMDGFTADTQITIIAATNRADVLDPALLRAGRFDRRVPVELPDMHGRLEILQVHVKNKPLSDDVDLAEVARQTTGFSGAQLSTLLNEAAIYSARSDRDSVTMEDIARALDRLTVGLSKTTSYQSEAYRRATAYHEAGHALVGTLIPEFKAHVVKVTIIPRSHGVGGFTMFNPDDEHEADFPSYAHLKGSLACTLGGRAAEEVVYGEDQVSVGAGNDLERVQSKARRMVADYGFNGPGLPTCALDSMNEYGVRGHSEETERLIDEQVRKLVNEAYSRAKDLLTQHRDALDQLADMLVDEETVPGSAVVDILDATKVGK